MTGAFRSLVVPPARPENRIREMASGHEEQTMRDRCARIWFMGLLGALAVAVLAPSGAQATSSTRSSRPCAAATSSCPRPGRQLRPRLLRRALLLGLRKLRERAGLLRAGRLRGGGRHPALGARPEPPLHRPR